MRSVCPVTQALPGPLKGVVKLSSIVCPGVVKTTILEVIHDLFRPVIHSATQRNGQDEN